MARVAIAQTTSLDDVEHNLAVATAMVAEAAASGAEFLAFPEVFLFLGGRTKKLQIAEAVDGPLVAAFQELAARHNIMLLLGSLHERLPGVADRVSNTSVLISSQGERLAVYRKIKLFDVELPHLKIRESDTIVPGTEPPPVIDTPIGRIGMTICFDLRFSALYQDLRSRGAEIICIPSNFTSPTGKAHWEVLLRARAIEHQVFVLAPAQQGEHNPKFTSHGHSMIIDPWGRVLAEKAEGVGLCYADVDLQQLHKIRAELPMKAARLETADSDPDRRAATVETATAALDL